MPERDTWDIEGAAQALHTQQEECFDTLCGQGYAFPFKESPETMKPVLELYPERLVVRYRSPAVLLDMVNARLEVEAQRVRVEASTTKTQTTAFFESTGSLIFSSAPRSENGKGRYSKPAQAPAEMEPKSEAEAEPKEEPKQEAKKEAENRERVVLTGRVGREPKLEDTKSGKKMLKIPIAVKEGEETRWTNVYWFGEKAEAAAEKLVKGRIYSVIGYRHESEQTKKLPNGKTTKVKVEVIYGAAIQEPKKK